MCRMDAPLVNVFVSELVRLKSGGQCETISEVQNPQPTRTDNNDGIPKMTNNELTQIRDQMRKVLSLVLATHY